MRAETSPCETCVIIPALDEEKSLGKVLADIPEEVDHVIVVDNGSTDRTPEVAREGGAEVVHEPVRGYGQACLSGIASLPSGCRTVAFLDADYSDRPADLSRVLAPILEGRADLVVGSRTRGDLEPGALLPHQRFGNWLATTLIRILFGHRYTDLGPQRAIRLEALERIGMKDRTYGWTVEMQVRALQEGLRVEEVPVAYRPRIGRSKISGTIKGTVLAGTMIIGTVIGLRLRRGGTRRPAS